MIKSRPLRYFIEAIAIILMLGGLAGAVEIVLTLIRLSSLANINSAFVFGELFGDVLILLLGYWIFMRASRPDKKAAKTRTHAL